MARNQGKRPGTASGSSSQSQSQGNKASDTAAKAASSDGGKTTPKAASSAIAAKIDPKVAAAKKPATSAAASSQTSKTSAPVTSSTASAAGASTSSVKASVKSTAPSSTAKSGAQANTSRSGTVATGGSGSAGGSSSVESGNGGFWPGLVGGVIGGAATALAASLFWVGSGDDGATAALESRVTAAEQQSGQVSELSERLAAIEAVPTGPTEGSDELEGRLNELETKFASLGETSSGDGDGGLGERLTALEQRLGGQGETGTDGSGGGDGLGDRLTALEERIESLDADLQKTTESQEANIATLASVQSTLPQLQDSLAATGTTIEEAGSKTTELSETVGSLNGEVQTLSSRIGEAEGRLDHLGGEYQRGAAMIVAIGDVDRAITKAEPFDEALNSLKLLVRDEEVLGETLTTLEPMASEGVPTSSDLKGEFGEMASQVLLAEGGDQSLADQVGNNVFGILNIRPSGSNDAEGSDSRAILSRAQASLADGDVERTLDELSGLEGVAAETAATWIERAKAMLSAEAAVVDLRAHAQALVAKGT